MDGVLSHKPPSQTMLKYRVYCLLRDCSSLVLCSVACALSICTSVHSRFESTVGVDGAISSPLRAATSCQHLRAQAVCYGKRERERQPNTYDTSFCVCCLQLLFTRYFVLALAVRIFLSPQYEHTWYGIGGHWPQADSRCLP